MDSRVYGEIVKDLKGYIYMNTKIRSYWVIWTNLRDYFQKWILSELENLLVINIEYSLMIYNKLLGLIEFIWVLIYEE